MVLSSQPIEKVVHNLKNSKTSVDMGRTGSNIYEARNNKEILAPYSFIDFFSEKKILNDKTMSNSLKYFLFSFYHKITLKKNDQNNSLFF